MTHCHLFIRFFFFLKHEVQKRSALLHSEIFAVEQNISSWNWSCLVQNFSFVTLAVTREDMLQIPAINRKRVIAYYIYSRFVVFSELFITVGNLQCDTMYRE